MFNFLSVLILIITYNSVTIAMEKKPYHHLPDGTFRNPEGSAKRDSNFKWSFKIFNQEKKKLDMRVPEEHVVNKDKVLSDLQKVKDEDYIAWYVDGVKVYQVSPASYPTIPNQHSWPFNSNDWYLILNLAIKPNINPAIIPTK